MKMSKHALELAENLNAILYKLTEMKNLSTEDIINLRKTREYILGAVNCLNLLTLRKQP